MQKKYIVLVEMDRMLFKMHVNAKNIIDMYTQVRLQYPGVIVRNFDEIGQGSPNIISVAFRRVGE